MCFEIVFEISNVSGIAIIADRVIVVIIVARFMVDKFVICEMAKAAPVRDFWNKRSVMNETDMTKVFTDPSNIKNCSRFNFPVISDPMIAA